MAVMTSVLSATVVLVECGLDELALRFGVGLAVVLEPDGEPLLQRRVVDSERWVATQLVAKCELVPEAWRACRDEMEVMRSPCGARVAEPVHLGRAVGRVEVAQLRQRLKARARGGEITDANEDIDHRLRGEPRDGGAANVVDPTDGVWTDDAL